MVFWRMTESWAITCLYPVVHGDRAGTGREFSSCNGEQEERTFSLYIRWSPYPPRRFRCSCQGCCDTIARQQPKSLQTFCCQGLLRQVRATAAEERPSIQRAALKMPLAMQDYRNRHSNKVSGRCKLIHILSLSTGYIRERIKKSRVYAKYTMPVQVSSGIRIS